MSRPRYEKIIFSAEFYEIRDKVLQLDDLELEKAWIEAGSPVKSKLYGVTFHTSTSSNGWACADNSSDKNPDKKLFHLDIDYADYTSRNPNRIVRWAKRACVIAHRYGMLPCYTG